MSHSNSRRIFIKTLLLSSAALVAAPLIKVQQVFAEMVSLSDPLVKALGYVPKAGTSKDRKDASATCASCQFYLSPGKPTSKCQLIPNGEVVATGWCRSYSKRAGAPEKKKA